MNNKLFALLLFLLVSGFFGWLYYDSRQDAQTIQQEAVHRDILTDEKGGAAADIQFVFHFPNPVYFHNLSTAQIETLSQSGGESEHYHIPGLTQAGYSIGTLYEVNWSKKWFKPEYKVWVENLRVEFTYDTLNVYVTSAYPEGSCEYQATLDHENRHVKVHRQIYEEFQRNFQERVGAAKEIPLPSNPVSVDSVEKGKAVISGIISGVLDPVFDQFKESLQTEQAKIDSPESYAELKQQCQHW